MAWELDMLANFVRQDLLDVVKEAEAFCEEEGPREAVDSSSYI